MSYGVAEGTHISVAGLSFSANTLGITNKDGGSSDQIDYESIAVVFFNLIDGEVCGTIHLKNVI